ncbi:hypothetical protein MPL3356_140170 [Mesorhizobium plurifarium]|uniref:Uncharacterized protein n=1 Tax=Mesorhizobium plurifarium TaxID=69974 RepID=A0A090GB86_MESPL|nr:hypothetical protein MPL3356_140170 [Mesorhizobium plurifarium]CDX32420.1 hypothetical protein MPLDJ20_150148 [Mesorhizobium plurifarium]CDX56439.1 hypothetical protein MPL3365_230226 [Mesorhizobium plurifarium]
MTILYIVPQRTHFRPGDQGTRPERFAYRINSVTMRDLSAKPEPNRNAPLPVEKVTLRLP